MTRTTSALALAVAAALTLPAGRASPEDVDTLCKNSGEVAVVAFDRIAEALPACEADPRSTNASCALIEWIAELLDQRQVIEIVTACTQGGHPLGEDSARLPVLMTSVGARLAPLAAAMEP